MRRGYHLYDDAQISGPRWLSSQTYDVIATLPAGTSENDFRLMPKSFKRTVQLALHQESKLLPVYTVYTLTVARNGPKWNGAAGSQQTFPQLAAGPDMTLSMDGPLAVVAARQQPISWPRLFSISSDCGYSNGKLPKIHW